MTTRNNHITHSDARKLQSPCNGQTPVVTPEYVESLRQREQSGEELTPSEKRICNVAYATEMAEQFIQLVAYAGFDVAIGKPPAWEFGERLSQGPTIGQQAVGYQYLLSVLLETPGALKEVITKLWSDLGRLPLSLEDIEAVTTAGETTARRETVGARSVRLAADHRVDGATFRIKSAGHMTIEREGCTATVELDPREVFALAQYLRMPGVSDIINDVDRHTQNEDEVNYQAEEVASSR